MKVLRTFTVVVSDHTSKRARECSYECKLKPEFLALEQELIAKFKKTSPELVRVYYRPQSIRWWARNVKRFLFVYDRPTKELAVLVNKKRIKGLVKYKIEQHRW